MVNTVRKVAIIGAGMTGLTVAHRLKLSGCEVHVFDKGRRPGGRVSMRRTSRGIFDHGAPVIDAVSEDFSNLLRRLGGISGAESTFFGNPGMRAILDEYARDVDVTQQVRVVALKSEPEGCVLRCETGRSFAHFDAVISTIPAPQARDLAATVDIKMTERLADIRMQPVWTVMVEFTHALDEFLVPDGGPVLRADRMGDKPGRLDDRNAWVIHMTPAFTEVNLNTDPAVVAPHILQTFSDTCGVALPDVRYLDAHRWRYAFAEQPLGRPFLSSDDGTLLVGGDWTLGRRAEHGFESGRAMANSVLSRIVEPV